MDNNYSKIITLNIEGIKMFLKDVTFPVYFLDFEAITNSKEWMFNHGMAIDQQLSTFSFLKIDSLLDDETKIKHYSMIGKKQEYELMAKSITDFYKNKGTVIVWGRDLETRGLGKLMKEGTEAQQKKIGYMISNLLDLQQLFYSGSFMRLEPSGKSSLDTIAKTYDVYKEAKIKDGKKAHFILQHATQQKIDKTHLENITKRVKEYNNADVINIKRVFIEVMKLI